MVGYIIQESPVSSLSKAEVLTVAMMPALAQLLASKYTLML